MAVAGQIDCFYDQIVIIYQRGDFLAVFLAVFFAVFLGGGVFAAFFADFLGAAGFTPAFSISMASWIQDFKAEACFMISLRSVKRAWRPTLVLGPVLTRMPLGSFSR